MTGTIRTLSSRGHDTITFDTDIEETVRAAEAHLKAARAQGYTAFKITDPKMNKAERMDTFDQTAERIVLIPAMQGG